MIINLNIINTFLIIEMENNKIKTKEYLQTYVRPVIAPLMEALALEQPENILEFTQHYINNLVSIS